LAHALEQACAFDSKVFSYELDETPPPVTFAVTLVGNRQCPWLYEMTSLIDTLTRANTTSFMIMSNPKTRQRVTAIVTAVVLVFMGRPVPMLSVVAIESLQFAFRNAAFMAPVGLGVQEGAYALLGPVAAPMSRAIGP
jgi:NhaP-type Na+/H+ and K+/H+ antiporter